jgi:hypothetical protein
MNTGSTDRKRLSSFLPFLKSFFDPVHHESIRLPLVFMSSPKPPPPSSGDQTGTTGTESRSLTTSRASGPDAEASNDEDDQTGAQKLWADIAASLMEISMNNKRLGNPSSQSLTQSQILVKSQALDRKHDWDSDVPQPERAEIRKAVDGAQKHCDKVPQDEAVGRLVFAIFSVLWGSFVNVELEDLDMKYLVSCIVKPASPDNALAPSVT